MACIQPGIELPMQSVLMRSAIGVLIVVLALLAWPLAGITQYYFASHDLFVALGLVLVWLGCRINGGPQIPLPRHAPALPLVAVFAVLLCGGLWAGAYGVMFDYPLTRDEHMVVFDGTTFAAGKPGEPLPAAWTGFASALVPDFLIDTGGEAVLASNYLPVNAAARGWFARIADPALFSPLLVAAGLVVLWRIARRLFPDHPAAQWLALGGYAASAQVLATGMTVYAMTGHLVLNLLWLALFLRDRWWSHAGAMVIGVLAMGLHQFVFHPLFAAPFVGWLLLQRRWALVLAYGAAYGAGLVLWLAWPGLLIAWSGVTLEDSAPTAIGGIIETRVLPLISRIDPRALPLMGYNLVRALAWNAAFLLPFLLALGPVLRRRDPVVLALVAGLVLTLAAMTILLPYQGHGWGYRYIHGLIGSLCLLAAYGFRELAAEQPARAGGFAVVLLAASMLVQVPAALWSAHRFVGPHARLSHMVEMQQADFVIIDDLRYPGIIDEVRNRADLTNRPLVFSRYHLGDDRIAVLCARGSVAVVGARQVAAAGLETAPNAAAAPLDAPCGRPAATTREERD